MNQVVDEEAMVRVVRSSSTAATAEHVSCGVLILAYITKLVFDHDVPRSQNLESPTHRKGAEPASESAVTHTSCRN